MGVRQVPAAVLKNKGVPVTLYDLVRGEDGQPTRPFRRVTTQAGEPVETEVWVQLTNMALADVEDKYGSLGEWETAMRAKPFNTLIDTLSIALDLDRRAVGTAMIDGRLEDYSTAVGAAFMLANGVDPGRVGEVVARGVRAAETQRAKLVDEGIARLLADETAQDRRAEMAVVTPLSTPGPTGSEPGSQPDGTTTSSGG